MDLCWQSDVSAFYTWCMFVIAFPFMYYHSEKLSALPSIYDQYMIELVYLKKKKIPQCKGYKLGLFSVLLRTIAWETASQPSPRSSPKEERGARINMNCFARKKHVVKPRKRTTNHKEQTSQLSHFSAFLCMGRYMNLGSFKIFFRYVF